MADSDYSAGIQDSPEPLNAGLASQSSDARFLISTLLVYVAKGDGNISSEESNLMIDLISASCGVRSAEAMEQLSTSVMALADDKDIAQKLQAAGRQLSIGERQDIFDLVVQTALADTRLDPGEVRAIKFAGQILGLSQDIIYTALRKFPAA